MRNRRDCRIQPKPEPVRALPPNRGLTGQGLKPIWAGNYLSAEGSKIEAVFGGEGKGAASQ